MDVSQYLEIFIDETKEHLQSLNTQILDLEQDPESEDTINEIFRAAHSLKGMAGTMGYKRMQNLTHDMENVFSEVRNGNIKVGANMIDILFQCLDALEEYLDTIQTTADEGTNENEPLIKALNQILAGSEGEEGDDAPEAEAKDSKAEEAEDGEKDKWTQIVLGTSEKSVIGKAQEEGKNVFGLTVYIQESCILKAARAFLVIKAVEELGEIIVSAPATQDIEDERFGNDFSIIVITDKALEDLTKAAEAVSEIETVAGGSIDLSAETSEPKAVSVAEQKQETAAPVAATGTKVAATPAATKQDKKAVVAKPVVNRTVRVDIEKLDSLMNLVSELIIAKNSLVSRTANNENEVSDIEYLESVTTNLHESVMKVRMVPIESVVQKFPRMIRDLQKKLGKKMELYMSGEETELDRTVVDRKSVV